MKVSETKTLGQTLICGLFKQICDDALSGREIGNYMRSFQVGNYFLDNFFCAKPHFSISS